MRSGPISLSSTVLGLAVAVACVAACLGPASALGNRVPHPADLTPRVRATADISGASWSEPDPCPTKVPLDDLRATYDPTAVRATLLEIARRRYSPGVTVIGAGSERELEMYFQGLPPELRSDFDILLQMFPTVVHEQGHEWDAEHSLYRMSYRVNDTTTYRTARIQTFPRSQILTLHPDASLSQYTGTYLKGLSGRMHFDLVLDEFVQYVHDLASSYCVGSTPQGSASSDRDGVLAWMWYTEAYLRIARERHPAVYRSMLRAPGLTAAILGTWRRAEYWLERTRGVMTGIHDTEIEQLVRAPESLAEIQRLAP